MRKLYNFILSDKGNLEISETTKMVPLYTAR